MDSIEIPYVVNLDDVPVFIQTLFSGTQGWVEPRTLYADGRVKPPWLLSTEEALSLDVGDLGDQEPGEAPFIRVATWRDPAGGGGKDNLHGAGALWCDVDGTTFEQAEQRRQDAGLPPPTMIVASGGGVHLYWRLREAYAFDESNVRAFEGVLKGIAKAIDGDMAATDASRCMRIPGSLNYKYDPPRPCRIVQRHPALEYDFGDFEPFRLDVETLELADVGEFDDKLTDETLEILEQRFQMLHAYFNDRDVGETKRKPNGLPDQSNIDYAMCQQALRLGVAPAQLLALMVASHETAELEQKPLRYYEHTARKAIAAEQGEVRTEAAEPRNSPYDVGLTGRELRNLRKQPDPESPLPGFLDPEPGIHALLGHNQSGKTTFGINLGLAWATGESPWAGAPKLSGTRVLILSNEQDVRRIDKVARRMAEKRSDAGMFRPRYPDWEDGVLMIGKDLRQSRKIRTLDQEGLKLLRELLEYARDHGEPFGLVLLDSLSRLKPLEIDENDNTAMSGWLDALAEISIEFGTYLVLVHHMGHADRSDARVSARGASAIGAVTVAQWRLDRGGDHHHRRLTVDGNAVPQREHTFRVADSEDEPGLIRYWRPEKKRPEKLLEDYLKPGEQLTQSDIAWRIMDAKPAGSKSRPNSTASTKAKKMIEEAVEDGRAEMVEGTGRKKKLVQLTSTGAADAS